MELDLVLIQYTNVAEMMKQLGYKMIGIVHYENRKFYDYAFEYKNGIYEDYEGIKQHGCNYFQQRMAEIGQSKVETIVDDCRIWNF